MRITDVAPANGTEEHMVEAVTFPSWWAREGRTSATASLTEARIEQGTKAKAEHAGQHFAGTRRRGEEQPRMRPRRIITLPATALKSHQPFRA